MIAVETPLLTVCETHYFSLNLRIRDEQTRRQYRYSIANLAEHLGRVPLVSDLTDDNVCRLMGWLRDVKRLHPRTVNDRRGRLHALWSWIARRGIVQKWPTTPMLPVPCRTPRAWTRDDLLSLMRAAEQTPGDICEIPASTWWTAVLALEWDTGIRASELLAIRWEWLDWKTGWLIVPAEVRKGGTADASYGLLPDTLTWLAKMRRPSGLMLGWTRHRSRYWQLWRELLLRAGLPHNRYTKTQALRRTFASWLARAGGSPSEALGHSSPDVTRKHYLDPTITAERHGERLPFRLLAKS